MNADLKGKCLLTVTIVWNVWLALLMQYNAS
jgi:hypothetical protein